MSFISYAQNYEDVMLWRALKNIPNGFYIDVGAAWPEEHSVTKAFYDRGWSGINIDPNPVHHSSLLSERKKDINLKLAISDSIGQTNIFIIENTGLSTLDKKIAEKHKENGWLVKKELIFVETLTSVCEKNVPLNQDIHFLKVDVEGFERQVLLGNDWLKYRPWIILVEATLPMTQVESFVDWEYILIENNYDFVYADGLNRYYLAKEREELRLSLRYPPNIFDGFIIADHRKVQMEAVQAEAIAQRYQEQAKQAQEQAKQAQEQAKQAQEQVKQTEAALQAQLAQLHAVYNSKSWRVTAPIRWLLHQLILLRTHGFMQRAKAGAKKVFRRVILWIAARPKIKSFAIKILCKLGIAEKLKPFIRSFYASHHHALGHHVTNKPQADFIALSPRAKKIYKDLKDYAEKQQKGGM